MEEPEDGGGGKCTDVKDLRIFEFKEAESVERCLEPEPEPEPDGGEADMVDI